MKLFNNFTQKKELVDFKHPIGIYVCGITPYDTTHIGHAFTFLTYDVLVRYLRFLGIKVTYVQNVTDIDDDILIRAKSQGVNWKELGKSQTQKHLGNMDSLNALRPDFYPKATENIKEMIKITKFLVSKKLAYIKNNSVYFHVASFYKFGSLSKFSYNAMLQIANDRGNYPLDPNKKDPLDFVLWQARKPAEPYWDSPWGKGRPGWHIECSAMSMKYLGPQISIHGGGEDLIFPHHECEIAQSENYTSQKFVKIWMHTAMVYSEEKKMSKSLGNMIFVNDLLKTYSPNTIRIFLLMHHYRLPWNYHQPDLIKAKNLELLFKSSLQRSARAKNINLKQVLPEFLEALDDDLDIPRALETLEKFAKVSNKNSAEVIGICTNILGLKFPQDLSPRF